MLKSNKIMIRGLKISARHGVYGFEKETEQPFEIDADIYTDFYAAYRTDNLSDTVNYGAACELLANVCQKNTFSLLEKLAYECAFALMENYPVKGVKLDIYKPQAPIKREFENVGVSVELARETAYLSLGSNMGDRNDYLDRAIAMLGETRGVSVKKVSGYIETPPYGGVATGEFLNCAVKTETFLPPHALLDEIHRIEESLGRVRTVHWGDRTADIDIIFYGNEIIRTAELTVPHADFARRRFVLQPLAEIAPDLVNPVDGRRVKEILSELK